MNSGKIASTVSVENALGKKSNVVSYRLDPIEWDFRDISNRRELHFATLYEYARSSKYSDFLETWFNTPFWIRQPALVLKSHFDVLNKLGINKKSAATIRDVVELIHDADVDVASKIKALSLLSEDTPSIFHTSRLLGISVRFPEFPKPWMKVRLLRGIDYIERRCFIWPRGQPALRDLYDPVENRNDPLYALYGSVRSANFKEHFLEIDWTASRTEIRKAFSIWLKKHHPLGPGNNSPGAALKWLSAYRLRKDGGYSDSAAKTFTEQYSSQGRKKSDRLPDYKSLKKWGEAVRSAEKLLEQDDLGARISQGFGHLWFH